MAPSASLPRAYPANLFFGPQSFSAIVIAEKFR